MPSNALSQNLSVGFGTSSFWLTCRIVMACSWISIGRKFYGKIRKIKRSQSPKGSQRKISFCKDQRRGVSHVQLRPSSYTFSLAITRYNFKLFPTFPLLMAGQLNRPAFLTLCFTLILAINIPSVHDNISYINSGGCILVKGRNKESQILDVRN